MIKNYPILVKREFWEHRGAFIKAPIIIGIVMLVLTVLLYMTGRVFMVRNGNVEHMNSGLSELANLSQDKLQFFWDSMFIGSAQMFLITMFFVLFFYILGSLFDDRKDGSILFWKSLPISDFETVISKIITAIIFVPLVYVVIFMLFMLSYLVLSSILLLISGLNPIELIWQPIHLFKGFLIMLSGATVQMLWALPIYGWLMFCSSWFKTKPFLWSFFIPLMIAIAWYFINAITNISRVFDINMFKIPLRYIAHAMIPFSSGSKGLTFSYSSKDNTTISEMFHRLGQTVSHIEIVYGAIFAIIFIGISIWVRRYRNTT